MKVRSLFWAALAAFTVFVPLLKGEGDELKFDVKGSNPGGKGGYTGNVTIHKTSAKDSATIKWVTGTKKEVTDGIAIKSGKFIGAGYGGKAFYALAVYQLHGTKIHGSWALSTAPEQLGEYELKGVDFDGKCKFADGSAGSVTFTEGKDGAYKVSWDLPSGHYDGIGLRVKDTLVAASGDPGGGFGVVAMEMGEDSTNGLWTMAGMTGVGKEVWTAPGGAAVQGGGDSAGNGQSVTFGGDTYLLKDKKSAPGKPTSELREYLRDGEDWDGYRKMVAFRMQHGDVTAAEFAQGVLDQTKKEYPNSYIKKIEMGDDSATVLFIVVNGSEVEFNLWNFRRTKNGIPSAQFVLRNKAPYDTQAKFKAEQDKNYDDWNEQIKKLGAQAEAYIAASGGGGEAPPPAKSAKKGGDDFPPELVAAIKADMEKCGKTAEKFMGLLQAGQTADAVALMSDSAFKKVSREDFVAALQKSNKVFGALQKFTPNKDATDFGMKEGVMTFLLQADAQYENAKVRETLRFIRNSKGEVEFVGYNRKAQE